MGLTVNCIWIPRGLDHAARARELNELSVWDRIAAVRLCLALPNAASSRAHPNFAVRRY